MNAVAGPIRGPRQAEPVALRELPLGAVRPSGWLAEQLRLQADGLTGWLEETWPDVGPDSAWLGGNGEDWERGPYYLDGLVPLAHILEDPGLIAKARKWVEAILRSGRPDGSFGPTSNDDWWPRMVALKALTQHADATDDPRIVHFLGAYFAYQLDELPRRPLRDWGRHRGADNILSVMWLYARTADSRLLELASLLVSQTADWGGYLEAFPCTDVTAEWDHRTHVVNVAMGLKTPAVQWLLDGDPAHRRRLEHGLANLDRYHGQVHGMFSGDEWLAGPEARRGVELCAVVEKMFTLARLIEIWGDADYGDRLERLAFNLLPAAMAADLTTHQYHQQANQVLATIAQRVWTQAGDDCTIFGLEPNFGCCTANLHQGWPKFVRSMWMEADDGGLVAVAHGPSRVSWSRAGLDVEVDARTVYPFDDTIEYEVRTAGPVAFPLRARLPGWCAAPELRVNGIRTDVLVRDGYVVMDRTWSDKDQVELRLPMVVRAIPRPANAIGVALGPLVFAHSPGEIWERLPGSLGAGDWEVRPRRSWNIALAVEPSAIADLARIERHGPVSPPFGLRTGRPPFGIDGVPLTVWVPGRRAPEWRLDGHDAAAPPPGPIDPPGFDADIPLVPYGCARLRIAEFPTALPRSQRVPRRGDAPNPRERT